MSMYEQAEKINKDLVNLFGNENINKFSKEQKEAVLNIMIRLGQVCKFRCRSNTAFDNFIAAAYKDIAKTERKLPKEDAEFKMLVAEVL